MIIAHTRAWRCCLLLAAAIGLSLPAAAGAMLHELVGDGADILVSGVPAAGDPALLWATTPACETGPRAHGKGTGAGIVNETEPFAISRASLAVAAPRPVFVFNPERAAGVCNPYRLLSNIVADDRHLYFIDNQGPEGAALWRRPRDANPDEMSQLLATVGDATTGAELIVFGVSVIAALNRNDPLLQPNVIVQYHKETGALLHGSIDVGPAFAHNELRFDGRYLYWLKQGALRRNDTTNGVLETIHPGPIEAYHVLGYEEQCGPPGCTPLSRIAFGLGNGLFEAETLSGATFHLYTSPHPNGRITEIARDGTHYYFFETRPTGGFDREQRLYRLSVGATVPELLYGPVPDATSLEGLRTDFTWLYFRERGTNRLMRLANDAAAIPVHDLAATGIEVTQGLQNTAHDVRLIADKRTIVRVYVCALSGRDVSGVTASLAGSNAEGFLGRLEPVNAGGKLLTVRRDPLRARLTESFQFELPRHWTAAGPLTLSATVNPAGRIVEDNRANNSVTRDVTFEPSPRLHVIYYNFAYDLGGTRHAPTAAEVAASRQRLRRLYPLGEPGGTLETPGLHAIVLDLVDHALASHVDRTHADCIKRYANADDRNMCASDYVHGRLAALRRTAGIAAATITYGNIAQAPAPAGQNYFTRGYAVGPIATGPSSDPTYAAHEVGHTVGRRHPAQGSLECGHSASDPEYPHTAARIANIIIDPEHRLLGLDFPDVLPGTMTLLNADATYDMMSYCWPYWVSDYTYDGIHAFLTRDAAGAAAAPRQAVPGDWLLVAGTLTPAAGEGGVTVVQRAAAVMDATPPSPGAFRLELRDATAAVLASHAFAATAIEEEPDTLAFDLVVPFVPGTAELVVTDAASGATLATVAVSATAPQLDDVRLEGAPDPVDGVVTVAWTASDRDGDALRFDVFASRDGGASYQPVLLGATGTGTALDTTLLGGGENRLRVVASDGVHTAAAESAPFTVAARPPRVVITRPVDGVAVDWAQLVSFAVEVDDRQDAVLDDERIVWRSDRGGLLGTGRRLQTDQLEVGEHVVEVTATNSLGATASAAVTVVVGDRLAPRGPTLAVAPQQLAWHVAAGETAMQTAMLAVDNAGDGRLAFDAVSDADWLQLDAATAVTDAEAPRAFTITAAPASVPAGVTSRATLTFTNRDDPDDVVVVPVALSRGTVFDAAGTQPAPPCAGDCDGNGSVTIDELIRGVNIALGSLPPATCAPLDTSGDGSVTIDELIAAVRLALDGC